MNMKNRISNFRHFARERRRIKLIKGKMSSYVVTYKQGESPQIEGVKVTLKRDTVLFYYSNGEPLWFLEDIGIQSFDDTVPGEATLLLHGQPNIRLVFVEQVQVDAFIEALKRVLAFSNSPSPESGRSTLSSASTYIVST